MELQHFSVAIKRRPGTPGERRHKEGQRCQPKKCTGGGCHGGRPKDVRIEVFRMAEDNHKNN